MSRRVFIGLSVLLGATLSFAATSATAASTCDDYSGDRFGLPTSEPFSTLEATLVAKLQEQGLDDEYVHLRDNVVEQESDKPRGSRPSEDNYIVWVDPFASDPMNIVLVAPEGERGISFYVHETGAERAEGALDPGTRPVHFVNCKYVAGSGL